MTELLTIAILVGIALVDFASRWRDRERLRREVQRLDARIDKLQNETADLEDQTISHIVYLRDRLKSLKPDWSQYD